MGVERGRGREERVIALRDIRAGGVFIFIRFYGLEKHCHAYQLALEQMAQYGCMFRHTHTHMKNVCAEGSRSLTVTIQTTASGRSTGGQSSGLQLF